MIDVVVVGGGPAGSTCAARFAQLGHSVVLLEQDHFPRFHIGESLLPGTFKVFDAIGVTQRIESHGFLPKHAAEFVSGDGSIRRRYPFAGGLLEGRTSAFEVDRADFDQLLLDHAEVQGVSVRRDTKVRRVHFSAGGVEVETSSGKASATVTVSSRILIDASGQSTLVGRERGVRQLDPALKNFALFSHYTGAARGSEQAEGDISIVLSPNGWWWVIPLAGDRTSLGLVAPTQSLDGARADEAYFERQLAASSYLRERFADAERVTPVRGAADYSYACSELVGEGWMLVGDAAAFIDPVFSTGVHLAVLSGFRAAEVASAGLKRKPSGAVPHRQLVSYQRWLAPLIQRYRGFVSGFYTPEFVELMLAPTEKLQLRQAVTSMLSGLTESSFNVAWRLKVFESLVRLNRSFNLAPRLEDRREHTSR
ncbi:MAG: tryptophan 7-halogenase [Polyangiaceae bacterium]|nr:tryptophan 7-halogenase [Myxococcales bacterium]MCB9586083.1 tryptophan 7-halogenase [Polyangiaceae bacterium]MCB9608900.1 tryptophan 7-halogenase [Polyangiaceae bacterium]